MNKTNEIILYAFRRLQGSGKTSFAKLGRMTKEETEKVIPAMQKLIEQM